MFIALDTNRNRISIENAIKGNQYFCPTCGEILTIRATESLAVKTHFAHKRGTICYDDWKHDMSEWHLSWQRQFPEQYKKSLLRKTALNIEQIFVSMEQLLNFSIALLRVKKLQNEMLSTFLVGIR